MSEILCLSAVIHKLKAATRVGQKKLLHDLFELIDNDYVVNDRLANRLMSNKENVRKETQKLADCVSEEVFSGGVEKIISSHLSTELELDLVHGLTQLIMQDSVISPAKRTMLLESAKNDDVYKFISVVILYAIQRNNIFSGENLPANPTGKPNDPAAPPHNLPGRFQRFIGRGE